MGLEKFLAGVVKKFWVGVGKGLTWGVRVYTLMGMKGNGSEQKAACKGCCHNGESTKEQIA